MFLDSFIILFSALLFQHHCVQQTKQMQPLQVQNTSLDSLTYNRLTLCSRDPTFQCLNSTRHTNLHHLSLCFDCSSTAGQFHPPFFLWLSFPQQAFFLCATDISLFPGNKVAGKCKLLLPLFMNLCKVCLAVTGPDKF